MRRNIRFRFGEHVDKGLFVILFAVFAATLAATVFFTVTMVSLNHLIQSGGEDVRVALVLQDLVLNLRQAESGQRGYIITGDGNYLQPYGDAVKKLLQDVAIIRSEKSLDAHTGQISQLASLTQQRLDQLSSAIQARKTGGIDAAAADITRTQKSRVTSRIQSLTRQIGQNTFQAVATQQSRSRGSVKRSLIITIVLDVFILAMCAIIVRYFHRAITRERAIEGAKNEFLSLASHQLRTPATSVKQYLGMLQQGFFGRLTKAQKEAVQIAYTSNETGISIINSLLNAAKLSLGRIQLARKPVIVSKLVQEVVDEYREQAAARQQTLRFSNNMADRKARLDAAYYKSIVENLVDNASKYSPEGSTISIRLRTKADTKVFELIVRDNGIGIERQHFDKLFLKFSRLQNEYSETSEGSGLGLYWVKQIVELHGGSVAVSSTVGRGTTFAVTMPL